MPRPALILAAALALAGCGGNQKAEDAAQDNLEATAANIADNLQALSANVADANQANMLVNESFELQNATNAADDAE